jgi:hypothetical protein
VFDVFERVPLRVHRRARIGRRRRAHATRCDVAMTASSVAAVEARGRCGARALTRQIGRARRDAHATGVVRNIDAGVMNDIDAIRLYIDMHIHPNVHVRVRRRRRIEIASIGSGASHPDSGSQYDKSKSTKIGDSHWV